MTHKQAPDFNLPDQDGIFHALKDYIGSWLVLYFYPRDNSPGCKAEACGFRDEQLIISQFGHAKVVGINKDSVASHKAFAQKHHLNFALLSDADHAVTKAYGAWRTSKSILRDRVFATRRNTYIINAEGLIVKEYLGINPKGHAEQIIADLQLLQSDQKARK